MGRKDSMACQLVVEELVVNVLLPAVVRLKNGKIRLSLHAGEEGAERTLTVDYTEFPEAEELLAFLQVPADAAEGQAFTDAAEEKASGSGQDREQEPYRAILAHKLRRLPEGEPGTAVFRIL